MFCNNCGKGIPDDSNFCQYCGNTIKRVIKCNACGKELESDSVYCRFCGLKVGSVKSKSDNSASAQVKSTVNSTPTPIPYTPVNPSAQSENKQVQQGNVNQSVPVIPYTPVNSTTQTNVSSAQQPYTNGSTQAIPYTSVNSNSQTPAPSAQQSYTNQTVQAIPYKPVNSTQQYVAAAPQQQNYVNQSPKPAAQNTQTSNSPLQTAWVSWYNGEKSFGIAKGTGTLAVFSDRVDFHKSFGGGFSMVNQISDLTKNPSVSFPMNQISSVREAGGIFPGLVIEMKDGKKSTFAGTGNRSSIQSCIRCIQDSLKKN